jgi:hypothetical protein
LNTISLLSLALLEGSSSLKWRLHNRFSLMCPPDIALLQITLLAVLLYRFAT